MEKQKFILMTQESLHKSVGIDLAREWNKGFIKKEKGNIKVIGPEERDLKELMDSAELVDVLHLVLILWKAERRDEMKKVLADSGFGVKDSFYRVAQAISEALPKESKEKKLLDGFLSGKERMVSEMKSRLEKLF